MWRIVRAGLLTGVLTATGARAADRNVVVVNGPTQPVPVTGQVSVTNSPTVSLSPGTTVLTRRADAPERTIFQGTAAITLPDGAISLETELFPLPTGKRLVVESISVEGDLPTGQKLLLAGFHPFVGQPGTPATQSTWVFAPVFTGTLDSQDIYVVGQATRFYADPSTLFGPTPAGLQGFASRSASAGTARVTFSVSGYLVDCSTGGSCTP